MASKLGLKHIETIHAVILTGSVTGAATRLHVTQPAISNVLRDAEERLGCQLFDRRGGRLLPTPLAEMLFDEIERSFTGLAAINEFCDRVRLTQRKRLRVACAPAVGATVLPLMASKLGSQGTFLSIHSRVAHHVAALVSSRKVDFGISIEVPEIPGVNAAVVAELPLLCYLPASHPLAQEPFVTPQQLVDRPMISLSRVEGIDDLVARAFQDTGRVPVPVAECPAAITACAMVAAGLGFTLFDALPSSLFDSSRVVLKPFTPEFRITYKAYWLKTDSADLDVAGLVALTREALDQAVAQANRASR